MMQVYFGRIIWSAQTRLRFTSLCFKSGDTSPHSRTKAKQ